MTNPRHEIPIGSVKITDGFWSARQRLMAEVTIPYMERILRDEVPGAEPSHALKNFRMAAGEERGEFEGMVFQDSDVAKWLEAAAYSLLIKPDAKLKERMDDVIALIGRAQQPDGYLNTFFTVKEPQSRWKNLLECHELYCAGHMMEAAAAYYETTGETNLLDLAVRLADHIEGRFGKNGQVGIPGHQEVEIGLLRLYRATGKTAYRDLALRFLDLRGQDPHWFENNTPPHPGVHYGGYDLDAPDAVYNQADMPVREQQTARGHAVRQLYLLTAMAEAASVSRDAALKAACERMFDSITGRRMYVTGAVGSTACHEAFTADYDLPGDRAYGETCASVAMAFFAHSMLQLEPDGRYADLLERELYNGALSGMQLDGKRFFYVNPLEVRPGVSGVVSGYEHVRIERPQWHPCACCPPNLARLLTSLGKYLWSEDDEAVYSHLFVGGGAKTGFAEIALETGWPWQGAADYTVKRPVSDEFTLALHIPAYVRQFELTLNGTPLEVPIERGYARIRRRWRDGDRVSLRCALAPRRLYADPRVSDAAGKVALARGPILYCFEEVDNGSCLSALRLPRDAAITECAYDPELLGGVVPLEAAGLRADPTAALYGDLAPVERPMALRAIPYYAWSNRAAGAMCVWLRE